MQHAFFITGTDTDVGKTTVIQALMHAYQQENYSTLALKPLAAGSICTAHGLRNDDALLHQKNSSLSLDYTIVYPFCLELACSPHIAAEKSKQTLTAENIVQSCQIGLQQNVDYIFIEGAGGWYTPINASQTLADVAQIFALPVIMVVGMKLGCLNHARLTYDAIVNTPLPVAGWIANCVDPAFMYLDENVQYLKEQLPCPYLGCLDYQANLLEHKAVWRNLLISHHPFAAVSQDPL